MRRLARPPHLDRLVRQGDWKLIQPAGKKPLELYHLARDPRETTNLAAGELAKRDALKRLREAEHAKDDPVLPADLEGRPH